MPADQQPPTVAFDHHSASWLAERRVHNDELRSSSPVAWNPEHGGFWFVTGYDEVSAVARDSVVFTPKHEQDSPDGIDYVGITGVPRAEGLPPVGIGEAEGEVHAAIRRSLNPFLMPAALERYRAFVEQSCHWFLDQRIAEGTMDMVLDFTNPVPAVWTLKFLGLPCEHWDHYGELFHATAAHGRDTPEYQRAIELVPGMVSELIEVIEQRRKDPGRDLLSHLTRLEVGGKRMSDEELVAVLWNLIGGGLDTTTSLTSLALQHLDEHPDIRRRLVESPDALVLACEEYLRWTSVNETLTRTCTRDTVLGGVTIKRGDVVMMSWLGANLDPKVFEHPGEVVVDRTPNPHLAFGVGAHRCIGMHVARFLFVAMMREVLGRIPDYSVHRDATVLYQGNPELTGVVTMPVTFTPAPRSGATRPF